VKRITYTIDGSDPISSGTATTVNAAAASVDITALGTTTVNWIAEDNVGNVSTVSSQDVKLDTSAPSAPTGFAFSGLSHAYYPSSGSTIYFQGGATGGFTVTASGSTDSESAVSGYTYPALGTGWSNSGGDYTFDGTATTQSGSVRGQNNAGLSSTGTTFTTQGDFAAPSSSDTCNGGACSADWYTASPVTFAIATAGETGASGQKRIVYTTDGSDPTIDASDAVTNGTAVAGSSLSFDITTLGQTTVKWIAEDNVGNVSSVSSELVKLDTSAPSAPTGFAFSALVGAYYPGTGSTVFFPAGTAGSFHVAASGATDAQSGIASYTYPALGAGWSNTTGGSYTFDTSAATQSGSITAENGAGLDGSGATFTAEADGAAPTSSLTCNGSACAGGWTNSTPVNAEIDGADGSGSGVANITYTTDGTDPTTSGTATSVNAATASFQISSSQTVKWFATDQVSNASITQSVTIQIDTTPPSAPTAFSFSALTNASYPGTGSTVYFKDGGAGGFTVTGSGATDGESGIGGYTYPALGSGWSNTNGVYTFDSSAGTQSGSVIAQDTAGNSGSGTSFTAQTDGTAPTSSLSCNGSACAGGWTNSSPVNAQIDASDGSSSAGVASITYTTDGSDPTASGTATTVSAATASFQVASSQTVKWFATDKVGNASTTQSTTIQIDTTAPTAPSLAFSNFTNAYYPGLGSTVFFQGGTGGFTVTASGSTDGESGVAGYTYPALGTGWTHTGGDYSFDGTAATQTGGVTAQNNASLSSSATSFTAQADASAPTSTISCNSAACSAGWYTSSPVAISIDTAGETGASGVKQITYTTDGSDPTSSGTATTVNAATANFNITALGMTTINWVAEDNVGNITAVGSKNVQLDTSAPSAPSLTYASPTHAYYPGTGSTVYFQSGVTGGFTVTGSGSADADSGIAGYTYPALGVGWSNTAGAYSFDATAGTDSGPVTAQNNAGLSSSGTSFTAEADGAAPTSTVQCNTAACSTGWYTASPVAVDIAAAGETSHSGVRRIVYTTDVSAPTINASDVVTNGTAVAGNTASFNATALGQTTVKWITEDNVGNISTVSSQLVQLDTSPPTAPTTFSVTSPTEAYYPGTGTKVFFKDGGTGGFTLAASGADDAESAVSGYTYPSLGSGWSNSGGAYTFTSSAGTQSGNVTAQNGAGLSSSGTTFTAEADGTAPTSSVLCNTAACLAGWYSASPVTVDIAVAGEGSGSGVKQITYTRDGSDPTSSGTATTVAGNAASLNVTALGTTTVKWVAEDNVGNVSTVSSQDVQLDTTAPSAPTGFAFSALTNAYYPGTGSVVFFQGNATGAFTIAASGSTDAESAVSGYTYPALGTGFAHTAGDYTFDATATTQSGNVHAQNNASLSSSGTSFTAQGDFNAPTSSIQCNTTTCSADWYTTSPVTVDISTGGETGASGVKRIKYTTDGSDPTSSGTATTVNAATATFGVTTLGTTTVKWITEDNVGNISTVSSQDVELDTTAPSAPTNFSFSALTNTYYPGTGTKVFIQTGAGGGFTATASGSTDAQSGVTGYTYPTLGTGFSHTAGAYTFTGSATTQSGSVTATNGAGLTGSGTSFTTETDGTPASSSLTCDGSPCPGGWVNTSPMTAGIAGSDGTGSGIGSITYTTDGSDPVSSGTATTVNSTTASFQVSSAQTVKWFTIDNVGNVSTTQSVDIQVDTTGPTAPTAFAYSGLTQAYYPGTGSTVYFRDGGTGGFTATASGSTDTQSGVAGYDYPALGGGGWSHTGNDYTFTSSATTQSGSVTAHDAAGNTGSGTSFTAQSDGTAPTSSVQCNSAACSAGWYGASPVTVAIGAADGGAGVKRVKVTTDGSDPTTSGTATTFNAASASVDVSADGTTTVKWVAEDNVGNVSSISSQVVELDTSAPSAPSLAFSAPDKAYWPGAGTTIYFQGGAAGSFTVTASGSADAHSGVAGYTYPALGTGFSHTAGAYGFTSGAATQSGDVTAQNGAGLSSSGTSFTAQIDSAAPTSSIQCNTAACSAGWYTVSPVSIAIGATDGGADVKRITYTTDGTNPTSSGTATTVNAANTSFNVTALGTTTIKWIAEDNVGNISSVSSQDVQLDTTAPSAPTSFSFSSLGSAYYPGTGSTVYFQGGGAGGFTVSAGGATDGESGIGGYTYPALGTGWSNANGAYNFDATAATQTGGVTAQNSAGLSGSSASFTAQSDAAAPTSSVQCNTAACSASWYTSSPVAIAIDAADGGSGVKRIKYTTDGTDPATSGTAATVNAATASFNVTTLGTTAIEWVAEDNVGNVSGVSTQTVKLDTSAPSAPSLAFSGFSSAYYPGAGSTVYFQGTGSGGFTVAASGSTDVQSSVSGYTYPSLGTGWLHTGGDYTFTGAAATQSGDVTAQNGAGLSSTATSFTAQLDSAAPTSSIQCNTAACSAGWYTSSPVSIAIGATDGGADVKRIKYTTDGSNPTSSGTATTVNAANASFNVTALGTTTIKWIGEDNVGNISSVSSQDVQLDTTAPSAPTGFAFSATTNAYYPGTGTQVFFQGGAAGGFTIAASGSADAQSTVAGYTYPALGTGWSHTAGDYTFTSGAATQSGDVSAQNGAGLSSAGTTFTAQADSTAPTSTIDCNTAACSPGWYTSAPVAIAISAAGETGESGVKRIKYTTDGTDPATSGTATTVNAATASFNLTTLGTTTIKWVAEDNVGNISTVSSQDVELDTTAASAPTSFSFSSLSSAYYPGAGATVYFDKGQAGGFTVTGSGSTDGESGIAGYTYGTLGSGWSNANGAYSFDSGADTDTGSVTAHNGAGLTGAGTSFIAHADAVAPTSTITCGGASCAAGWTNVVPVNIDITGDDGTGSGVKHITYTTDGTDPATSGTATTVNAAIASFQLSSPQTIKWIAVDNLDHTSSVQSITIQVDSSAPSAPSSLVFSAATQAYWPGSGTTVFFKTGATGGFTVTASGATDAQSGIAGYTYPALGGGGWTHTGGDYTFDATATTQTGSAYAQNNASLTSASGASFTAEADGTAPTSSIECNTAACSGSWYTTSPVAVAISTAGESGASGVKRITYTTDGTNPTSSGTATTINAASASFNVTALGATTIKWIAEDNVGNVSTPQAQTVQLDTSAPNAPTLAFSGFSHAYYSGSGATVFFQGGGSGGFTVDASGSTDADSGLTGYTYPSLGSGWSNTGGAYTFSSSSATQSGSITAQNAAGLSSSGVGFTAQADSSTPTAAVTCNTFACSAGWYVTSPVAVSITTGGESGASGTRRIVYTTDGTDPTIDGSDVVTAGTGVAGATASFNISAQGTTTVKWIAEDNVGNITAVGSKTVQIDTIAPATTIGPTEPSDPSSNATPTFDFSSSEASTFECSVDGGAYSLCLSSLTLPTLGQGPHTFDVRATDVAGNTDATPATYAWTLDTVPPAATMTSPGAHVSGTISLTSTSTDVGGTGIASVTFEYSLDGNTWTPISTLPWNTKTGPDAVADNLYDLHVVAVDNAGNSATSGVTNVRVDNTPPGVTITSPVSSGDLANTVTLTALTPDADPTPAIVWQVAPHGTATWTVVPAVWNTKTGPDAVADGHYDVKATATDWAGNVDSATVTDVTVDNRAPNVAMTVPADSSYVNAASTNPFTVNATADDNGTGVQQVVFSSCTTADCTVSTVTSIGTDTTGSAGTYGANWPLPANGNYWIRAVATDNVGHARTSINAVTVDRTLPDTNLLTKPGDPSNLTHPAFTFSASEATQSFECNLDSSSWTTCASPYSLASTPADGQHTLEIRAIDLAGNVDSSPASWTWHEDRTAPTATLTDPAATNAARAIRGTVTLGSTTNDPTTNGYASGVDNATLTYEYSSDGTTWAPIATPTLWDTTLVTDGVYQMHVLITDHAGNGTTSATVGSVKIDNTPPVTAQDDPGQYLHNTISLTGTAADPTDPQSVAGSGVDHVDFQISPAGAGTWTTVGTDTTEPYAASFNTTTLADGHYDFRTVAYDVAGNQTNATSVDNRLIDNTAPVAQIVDPGANLHATVNLATDPAGTNDPGGVNASGIVATTFEISGDGGATWQPASATWNTTGVADGLYDIRVTVRDAAGNDSTPSVVSSRRVDNTKPVTTASGVPSGFAASDVTVTLNPSDGGSGVTDTLYQVDGGAVQHGTSVLVPAPSNGSNDGSHTISFQSVDGAGNIEDQHSVSVHIDATPPACPTCSASDYVSGTVSLRATPSDSGAGVKSVAFEYLVGAVWTPIGTDTTGTAGVYSASWTTTAVGDGAYHLRALITDLVLNVSTIDLHPGGAGVVVVDNTAPSAAVGAPSAGTFVSGTGVTISATSGDANPLTYAFLVNGSVIASGSSTSTTWNSTTVADGPVQLTVRATDPAGNTTTSAAVTVTVDNQSPTPTVNDPGEAISGSPTISATTDADTVTVEFQRRAQGSGTWISIATVPPPFQTAFATGGLTDGTYELQAIATDGSGHTGTSAVRTVVVDNTLPTGSIVQPNAGNTIGGPSSQLHATASDPSGSGVRSVEFQYTLSGTNGWTSIATVTGTPYNATWDATAVPTNDYDLRIRVADNAGNVRTTTPITVHIDSTAPTVTLANPGANLSGTVGLTATTVGPDAVSVSFEVSPAGANTWQTISTDNASPWTASFDTHTVADGLYDIRAKAVDALGNVGSSLRTGIRIDNTAPSITAASPADGSVVASASSIVLDASEIATLSSITLDGLATVAPTITGTHADFATGALSDGPHTLSGTLTDASGKTSSLLLHFTIYSAGSSTTIPYVEKNTSLTNETTLTAPGGGTSVTMPSNAWSPTMNPGDWLVLKIEPRVPTSLSSTLPIQSLVDVSARWAMAGGEMHQFGNPLEIALANGQGNVPATFEGSSWRLLRAVPTAGQLPADWSDGYWREDGTVHVLTRHLTLFALVKDQTPPGAPTNLNATVNDGTFTLRWDPSVQEGKEIANFVLFADDQPIQNLGATQLEYAVGPFDPADTRSFSIVEIDTSGNVSVHSTAIKVVPQLAGMSLDDARTALTAKGFGVGDITVVDSQTPAGTIVGPAIPVTAPVGSVLPLQVSAGPGQPATKFVFSVVGTKRLVLAQRRYIGVHLSATRATTLSATLVNSRGARVHTWHVNARAGISIAKLALPKSLRKPGRYVLLWTATSGGDVARKSMVVQILRSAKSAAAEARKSKKKDVVLAGAGLPKQLPRVPKQRGTRFVAATGDSAFALTGDWKRNVQVIVVDADQYPLSLVHNLRTVFPSTSVRLVVLTNDPKKRVRAIAAGATIALPKRTPNLQLAKVVAALSSPAQARTSKR